jgi:hypothetical protein
MILQPIQGEPVLRLETEKIKALIIADLHLGIEKELSLVGISLPSQTNKLLERTKAIEESFHPNDIFILGDLQHIIPLKEEKERNKILKEQYWEVYGFLEELGKYARLHLIPGNHDGGLDKTPINELVRILPSSGIKIKEIGLFHGHAWPSKEVIESNILIMAHSHPTIRLRDSQGYQLQERCWVKGEIKGLEKIKKYSQVKRHARILIIMPTFNPLCGGIAVNKEGVLGPMKNLIDLQNAEVFLLDGINLGKISNL